MKETFALDAVRRDDLGKGASRRLRREGKVPAIVYGGTEAPLAITIDHNELLKHLEHEAFYSHVLDLSVDGKNNKVILRDLSRHPYKPTIVHADFQRVSETETIRMSVPLHFVNKDTCPGAKAGGIVNIVLTDVEVSCTAANLPEFIEVDMSNCELGESIHLSQIALPAGVSLVALMQGEDHDQAVVAIHVPKSDKATDEETEESEEAGE